MMTHTHAGSPSHTRTAQFLPELFLPSNVNRSSKIPKQAVGGKSDDGDTLRSPGGKRRQSVTFNVDVGVGTRQDLKHRLHMVPLARSVEEGLPFQPGRKETGRAPPRERDEPEETGEIQN